MESKKVYHLCMIYKPNYVIKDFHGRHTHNHTEVKFEVGVMENFQELVKVSSKIDHTNAYVPNNIPKTFGFWGTSFDKRDRIPRDSMKMVTADEALHIMLHGPNKNNYEDEDTDFDFVEAERREKEMLRREMDEDDYEDFLADIEYRQKSYTDAVY